MDNDLVLASLTPIDHQGSPEKGIFDLFIHPAMAFTASHVMPPFDTISSILRLKNTDGV